MLSGLSQLSRYGSRDTAASDSSAHSSSAGPASSSSHGPPALLDQQLAQSEAQDTDQASTDQNPAASSHKDAAEGALDASMTNSAAKEAVMYGPAPRPANLGESDTNNAELPAELAEPGQATAAADSLAEQNSGQAAPRTPEMQAVPAAALEPSEPAAPGMEPEGPMPSPEMQLIITKLAGFIQVGFHLAPAPLPVRCPHLSLAFASAA